MKTLALSTITALILTACGQSLPSGLNANSANQSSNGSGATVTTTLPSTGTSNTSSSSNSGAAGGGAVMTSPSTIKDSTGASVTSGRSYFLQNTTTTNCLDVTAAARNDGAVVQPYGCLTAQTNQQWMVQLAADGSMTLTSLNSGLCLDLALGDTYYQQYDCSGSPNQSFKFNAIAGGGYQVTTLDRLTSCAGDNGTLIKNASCGSVGGQIYQFVPAAQTF